MQIRKSLLYILLTAALAVLLWLPRARALDRYATVDETKWLLRSANFFQALYARNLAQTYQSEHPGVTVTWAGLAGFVTRFRGYAGLSGEQMSGPTRLLRFLKAQKQNPVELLAAGRLFMVIAIVGAHVLSFAAAVRLIGWLPAGLGFGFLALDPYLISLSRLLHLDGLLSALMLIALLWFLEYLYCGRKPYSLVISALAAGLSCLTKSPAMFLFAFCGALYLWVNWPDFKRSAGVKPRLVAWVRAASPYLAWLLLAGAVFVLFWPAMWVDPFGTLRKVIAEALSYTVEGNQNVIFFNGRIFAGGESAWYFYPLSWLWYSTPVVLAGMILALRMPGRQAGNAPWAAQRKFAVILAIYAVSFVVLLSLAGQKYTRYILPAMVALILIAGLGWYWLLHDLWQSLVRRRTAAVARSVPVLIATGLVALQLWAVVSTYPYYQYFNPLLGGAQGAANVLQIGWGEGLDQAARFLNAKPEARRLRVISWYGEAPFAYFFSGNTVNMPVDAALDDLLDSDYIVLYFEQTQRQLPSPEVLDFFSGYEPEYTVTINGLEYVRVFNRQDLSNP